MQDTVVINFQIEEGPFKFSDAIHLPSDHAFTEEQIEAMKQERFQNWKNFVLNPPVVEVPDTVEPDTVEPDTTEQIPSDPVESSATGE